MLDCFGSQNFANEMLDRASVCGGSESSFEVSSCSIDVPDMNLAGDLVDRLSESLDISGRDTCDRDSTVFGSVDRVFLGKLVHLFGFQACVSEHTNL